MTSPIQEHEAMVRDLLWACRNAKAFIQAGDVERSCKKHLLRKLQAAIAAATGEEEAP